jgi:hypothetical protein
MSILKSLFGGKKEEEPQKPNIDTLLASPDSNGSIIELDNYICKLCSWGKHLEKLSEPQRVFYLNQELEREINSGGFESFFYNSYGTYADETVSTLKTIGANQFAQILQEAMNVFPNGQVPKDIDERQELMDSFAEGIWEQIDQKFYAYPENLNELNLEYVRRYKDSF